MDNLINILMFLSPAIIYYTAGKPAITNYKLRKDFKLKRVNTSILPKDVLRKVNDIDEKRLLEQQFGPFIIRFVNTIKTNIPNSDLTLFYNNFNSIEVLEKKFKTLNSFRSRDIGGVWVTGINTIVVSPDNYQSTINHELFHASTTYIDPDTNTIFVGFEQQKGFNKQIGNGLNEGYTQYLAEKYFGIPLNAYNYEKRISELVEMIVGQEKMQSLYFNANLKGLIDSLKQYNTEENVYKFITTLDFLNKHLTDKRLMNTSNQIRLTSLKNINYFLIYTYIQKVLLEQQDEINDTKKLFDKLEPFLSELPREIKIHGKILFSINNYDFATEIINSCFFNYDVNATKNTTLR